MLERKLLFKKTSCWSTSPKGGGGREDVHLPPSFSYSGNARIETLYDNKIETSGAL